MKPAHDIGGNAGLSVVPDIPGEPKFEMEWHRRALGLTIAIGFMGAWSIDASRYARESLPLDCYKRFSYYEKWLGGLLNLLFQREFISENELKLGRSEKVVSKKWKDKILKHKDVIKALETGAPTRRLEQPSKFSIGQAVQVKHPSETLQIKTGHTRLPHYIANKNGTIIRNHGSHVFPNTVAHFLGECPENLYSVEFCSRDLWEENASLIDKVVVDCWESYLDFA